MALHGFSQHGRSFAELAGLLDRRVLAPDLPGHGRTRIPPTVPNAVAAVASLLEKAGPPTPLLGYSQGGRIALQVALERPELISRLVLVSCAPGGLAGVAERAARRERDEAWALLLDTEGLETFLDRWLGLPLFEGLERRGAGWRARDRAGREENDPGRLAAALLGMGQGIQAHLGGRLGELTGPVLVVAGAEDERYLALARWMAERIPDARVEVLAGVGHPVVGEDPGALARAVSAFLG